MPEQEKSGTAPKQPQKADQKGDESKPQSDREAALERRLAALEDQGSGSKPSDREKALEKRLADMELQLAQSRATAPLGTTPNHGAGVGEETAETWSMHEQGLAYAGNHPDQNEDKDD